MASITFAVDESIKARLDKFSWVNWSEIARENLIKKEQLEELREKLVSKEEKELTGWSVQMGQTAKKDRLKKILSRLSHKEKEEF